MEIRNLSIYFIRSLNVRIICMNIHSNSLINRQQLVTVQKINNRNKIKHLSTECEWNVRNEIKGDTGLDSLRGDGEKWQPYANYALTRKIVSSLRKAYNPVYRARKSRDIHSLVFALPLTSLTLDHPSHRETLPLIPFHFTITFYGPSTSIASIHAGFGNGNQPRKG